MIDRLCRLYGLELGYAGRLRLLRGVLYQMAFAGAQAPRLADLRRELWQQLRRLERDAGREEHDRP